MNRLPIAQPDQDFKLIVLKQDSHHADIFDILLTAPEQLLSYDSVEIDFHFYPYSREVTGEKYVLAPYEEQVDGSQHSAYDKMPDPYGIGCGLGIGFALLAVVGNLNPSDLAGVESLVTLAIATYGGNKVVWPIIERGLIQLTAKYKIQWKERYYTHIAKLSNTSTNYLEYARKIRYSVERLLPAYMSLDMGSNSSTLRMKLLPQQLVKHSNAVNLGAFHFDGEEMVRELRQHGFQFGIHVKLNEKVFFVNHKKELLQTIFKDSIGALVDGVERPNVIEVRETINIGRLKYYKFRGHIEGILLGKELNQ